MKTRIAIIGLILSALFMFSCGESSDDPTPTDNNNNNGGGDTTEQPTFEFVSFTDTDVDVTFYKPSITRKRFKGLDSLELVVTLQKDSFIASELTIKGQIWQEGDMNLAPEYYVNTIGLVGKGFTGATDEYQVAKLTGPGQTNHEHCKVYQKDGRWVIDIKEAVFENLNTGFTGKLNMILYWDEG